MNNKQKTSGVSSDRAYQLQRKLIGQLADLYSLAAIVGMTHEKLFENAAKLYQQARNNKAPSRVFDYASGYEEAKRNEIYKHHLVWMLSVDGHLLTSKQVDELTEQENVLFGKNEGYRSPWSRVNGDLSCHVWKDVQTGRPRLDRPFDEMFGKKKDEAS